MIEDLMGHDRAVEQGVGDTTQSLDTAAKHASIFNALTAIAAGQ